MKVLFEIRRGRDLLFSGHLTADSGNEDYQYDGGEAKFLEDVFSVERCINAEGYLRCHVTEVKTQDSQG